jgi:hypothetical protein
VIDTGGSGLSENLRAISFAIVDDTPFPVVDSASVPRRNGVCLE